MRQIPSVRNTASALRNMALAVFSVGALCSPSALQAVAERPLGLTEFAETRNAGLPALAINLSEATIVASFVQGSAAAEAVELLRDEVYKRTLLRLPVEPATDHVRRAEIVVGLHRDLLEMLGSTPATHSAAREGYRIVTRTENGTARLIVSGQDERGVLYGVGHLLRTLRMGPARLGLAAPLNADEAPRYPVRGIQLGYRGMSNTYAGWDAAAYEQQIRDLAVFGANVIELVVGFGQSAPEFPLPFDEMMRQTSLLTRKYGLDYWIVSPVKDRDYTKPGEAEKTLAEWEHIYKVIPHLEGVFIPGGDPGSTPPEQLMPLLAQQAALLRRYHPKATIWMSAQGFNAEALDYFFEYLQREQPEWLTGVVSAAWTDLSTADLRRRTPERYQIISSTDIGHILHSQQPMQNLDTAIAITQGREPICPRPTDMAHLVKVTQPGTAGSLAYSDGVSDDINKFLWAALNWNPEASVDGILNDYTRYLIGERLGSAAAKGIWMLEKNWQGALLGNEQVTATFAHFRALEKQASPAERRNWRFLSLLYRAYCDAYTRKRLINETKLEEEAIAALRVAPKTGAAAAMKKAAAILEKSVQQPVGLELKTRIFQLAEALFQTVHMKLSVPLYGATNVTRGANLDSIDWPLNNRVWLKTQFAAIGKLKSKPAQLERLARIANWTDAGPGGFYDDPGRAGAQPRVQPIDPQDARFHHSPHAIKTWMRFADFARHRISWMDHVATLAKTPLEMNYEGLDQNSAYVLRVVYGDTKLNNRMRLVANDRYEIHGFQKGPSPAEVQEFAIPREATQSGRLTLRWERAPDVASIKGVCHVSEIWLVRKTPAGE